MRRNEFEGGERVKKKKLLICCGSFCSFLIFFFSLQEVQLFDSGTSSRAVPLEAEDERGAGGVPHPDTTPGRYHQGAATCVHSVHDLLTFLSLTHEGPNLVFSH